MNIKHLNMPVALVALASLGLAACGGGGGGGAAPAPTTLTGVFTDAPVANLSYTSSPSGLSGTTSDNGTFQYREGDTVSFSAGPIPVGSVPALPTITPREVAAVIATEPAQIPTITQNLFQFFQSLDTDDDPNTITFPTPTQLSTVTFGEGADFSTPATFFNAAEFSTALNSTVEAIQVVVPEVEVVSVEAAIQHALEQANLLLSGTWVLRTESTPAISVTFFANGEYVFGGFSNDENCKTDVPSADTNGNGIEYGAYVWNPITSSFSTSAPFTDSTGSCGFNEIPEFDSGGLINAALQVVGNELRFFAFDVPNAETCAAEDGTAFTTFNSRDACLYVLDRAKGTAALGAAPAINGLEGSYGTDFDLALQQPFIVTIARTGTNSYRYLVHEVFGGNNIANGNGDSDGIEIGTFTVDSSGLILSNTVELNTIRPDGETGAGGLIPDGGSARITLDANNNLQFEEYAGPNGEPGTGESDVLTRLPLVPRIAQSAVVGTYFPAGFDGTGNEVAQEAETNPAYLTFFENGEYLLGTFDGDPDCVVDMATDKPDGNGIEYGKYRLDVITRRLNGSIPTPTATKRYVDTNGECGLVHKGGDTSERQILIPLTDAGDGEGILLVGFDIDATTNFDAAEDAFNAAKAIVTIADAKAYVADPDAPVDSRFFAVLRPVISQASTEVNLGLNGTWKLTASSATTDLEPVLITFLGNRYFLTHGSVGDPGTVTGIDGIEVGTFMVDANQFCVSDVEVDTTGDAGLVNGAPTTCGPDLTIAITAVEGSANSFTFTFPKEGTTTGETDSITFTRISREYAPPAP